MTMTTQLSTRLAALAVALMVNGMMIGGVAYLFSAKLHQPTAANGAVTTASARSIVPTICGPLFGRPMQWRVLLD
jgi:hypothetical protein